MTEAYIIDAKRSPMFRSSRGKRLGTLSKHGVHPVELAKTVIGSMLENNKIFASDVDDLIFGCATPTGMQGFNVGRLIASSLSESLPGNQVNRLCGSGADALRLSTALIKSGETDLMLAGGMEHMSAVPMGADMMPPLAGMPSQIFKTFFRILQLQQKIIKETLPKDYDFTPMGVSGDLIAEEYEISRRELDEFALQSHRRAYISSRNGVFDREIVPLITRKGLFELDEGIRPNSTLLGLTSLRPSFGKKGFHTAGNSSQLTDGAAAILLGNQKSIDKFSLVPKAKIISNHVIGSDVKLQLTGPIKATKEILEKNNLTVDDIDLFEINEAFSSVVLATQREVGIPIEKVNVNGGAIALGHPLGCSGARLIVTLLYELERRNLRRGLSVLCIGGGQAIATIIERI